MSVLRKQLVSCLVLFSEIQALGKRRNFISCGHCVAIYEYSKRPLFMHPRLHSACYAGGVVRTRPLFLERFITNCRRNLIPRKVSAQNGSSRVASKASALRPFHQLTFLLSPLFWISLYLELERGNSSYSSPPCYVGSRRSRGLAFDEFLFLPFAIPGTCYFYHFALLLVSQAFASLFSSFSRMHGFGFLFLFLSWVAVHPFTHRNLVIVALAIDDWACESKV